MPFVSILLSVVWSGFSWLFRSVLIKFVVFFAFYFLLVEFLPLLLTLLPNNANIDWAAANVPASVWWFLDAFGVPQGLSIIAGAYGTRFLIRRLPVIG